MLGGMFVIIGFAYGLVALLCWLVIVAPCGCVLELLVFVVNSVVLLRISVLFVWLFVFD